MNIKLLKPFTPKYNINMSIGEAEKYLKVPQLSVKISHMEAGRVMGTEHIPFFRNKNRRINVSYFIEAQHKIDELYNEAHNLYFDLLEYSSSEGDLSGEISKYCRGSKASWVEFFKSLFETRRFSALRLSVPSTKVVEFLVVGCKIRKRLEDKGYKMMFNNKKTIKIIRETLTLDEVQNG